MWPVSLRLLPQDPEHHAAEPAPKAEQPRARLGVIYRLVVKTANLTLVDRFACEGPHPGGSVGVCTYGGSDSESAKVSSTKAARLHSSCTQSANVHTNKTRTGAGRAGAC